MSAKQIEKVHGLLLGTAVADAIGLPTEGMTPTRIEKLGWGRQLRHRFFFGWGMWSDYTEQTIMIAQALLRAGGDVEAFRRSFAWELRWWLLGMPAATGLATARAIVKLWLGISPKRSGVFSAGNGSAMRTAPIAAVFLNDAEKRKEFVTAQTRVTHSDPKALIGSLAVTELCAMLFKASDAPRNEDVLKVLRGISDDAEWLGIVAMIDEVAQRRRGAGCLLDRIGGDAAKGISGYVYQTVPCVVVEGMRCGWDYRKTVESVIRAGGDTDTAAAIAGALCGALGEMRNIPRSWIAGLKEWPTRKADLELLARALARGSGGVRIRRRWSPFLILRNLFFLGSVLMHGVARLLPTWLMRG